MEWRGEDDCTVAALYNGSCPCRQGLESVLVFIQLGNTLDLTFGKASEGQERIMGLGIP